jgi:hypothetical protein
MWSCLLVSVIVRRYHSVVASAIDAIVMRTLSVDINMKVYVRHIERMLLGKLGLIYLVVLQVIEEIFLT